MPETAPTNTAPETVATPPATNTANPAPATAAKQPPWGTPDNFDAEKAWELIQNLRNEKADPALKGEIDAIRAEQEESRKRIAAALGLTEPPKTEDALAETVKSLQAQFQASQLEATRLRIAAEHNIPAEHHDLLTETDTEKLKTQAEKVGALLAAANPNGAGAQPPAFQVNPGQGQGGQPSDAAAEQAEYERFYPSPNRK